MKGYLVLESGECFEGELFGYISDSLGEVVFNTSMTGYQEMITDPSYAGQILTFCYPLIGNYGINLFDNESKCPQVAGVIMGDLCEQPSHYLTVKSFSEQLHEAGVTGLSGVDTRALVQAIRKQGTVKGVITTEKTKGSQLIEEYDPPFWVPQVSITKAVCYDNPGPHVVLFDYGYKKSILDALLAEKCQVTVVPFETSFEEVELLDPQAVVFSNGPGDPMSLSNYLPDIKRISETYPTLGICLGHQLISLAFGAQTEKLKYGHRGGNHPVKDLLTGKVHVTSQNHSYVVSNGSIDQSVFDITHVNVNDKTIEGLKHKHYNIQTVQFHPEAHPGPSDTEYIFTEFIRKLPRGEAEYAFS